MIVGDLPPSRSLCGAEEESHVSDLCILRPSATPARHGPVRVVTAGTPARGDRPAPAGLQPLMALGVVGVVLGVSAILGRRNAPDPSHPGIRRWYRGLDKPGFTPRDAAFGAVWPVLEAGLAVGGYRLLRQPSAPARDAAVGLWLLNTAMVGGWTELFFRERRLGASAVASAAMVLSGGAYVAAAATVDRPAAAAGVPFVAWIGFATLLAGRIWRDNSGRVA